MSSLFRIARRNAIFPWDTIEQHLFNMSMGLCKKDVTPLLTHWSYVYLALTHWYVFVIYIIYPLGLSLFCTNPLYKYEWCIHLPCGGYFIRHLCWLWVCLLYWFQQYWCPVLADLSDPWLHSDSLLTPGDRCCRVGNQKILSNYGFSKVRFVPKPKILFVHSEHGVVLHLSGAEMEIFNAN